MRKLGFASLWGAQRSGFFGSLVSCFFPFASLASEDSGSLRAALCIELRTSLGARGLRFPSSPRFVGMCILPVRDSAL
jgi:hypothetical protein